MRTTDEETIERLTAPTSKTGSHLLISICTEILSQGIPPASNPQCEENGCFPVSFAPSSKHDTPSCELATLFFNPSTPTESDWPVSEHASAARLHAVLSENPVGERAKAYRKGLPTPPTRPARRFGRKIRQPTTRVSRNNKGENVARSLGHQTRHTKTHSRTELGNDDEPFRARFHGCCDTRPNCPAHAQESVRELGLTATQSSPQAACAALSPSPQKQIRGGEVRDAFIAAITVAAATAEPTRPNSSINDGPERGRTKARDDYTPITVSRKGSK